MEETKRRPEPVPAALQSGPAAICSHPKPPISARNTRTHVSCGDRHSLFPFSHFGQLHTMLPSTRNGSGTLRSDIYYTTVFRVVKLVSTKFFKKKCSQTLFRAQKVPPCPAVFNLVRCARLLKRQDCDSVTRFQAIHRDFSQKIDTVSQ